MSVRHDQPAATWIRDAEDDVAAAQHLFEGGHVRYVAFLLHLAVEKALKAVYRTKFGENPPVTHDLRYLADRTELLVPVDLHGVLDRLNEASILHLYPGAAGRAHPFPGEDDAHRLLEHARELMDWITDHL